MLDFVAYLERLLYLRKLRDGIESYRSEWDRLAPRGTISDTPSRIKFDDNADSILEELERQRFSPTDLDILAESVGVDDLAKDLSIGTFRLVPLIKRNIIRPDLRLFVFPGVSYAYFLRDRLEEIKRIYRAWERRGQILPPHIPEIEGRGASTFREELRTLEYPAELKQFYSQGKELAKKIRNE